MIENVQIIFHEITKMHEKGQGYTKLKSQTDKNNYDTKQNHLYS